MSHTNFVPQTTLYTSIKDSQNQQMIARPTPTPLRPRCPPIPLAPLTHNSLQKYKPFFEHVLDQKLKERDEYYLRQIQVREEEVEARRVLREQEFQTDLAAHRVTLESVSRQLEESRVNRYLGKTVQRIY